MRCAAAERIFRIMAERARGVNDQPRKSKQDAARGVTIRLMDPLDERPEALDRLWDPKLELLGELLDQLESDDAMDLEELDGFFAALHCSPEYLMPSEYLPEIVGGEFEFPDLQAAQLFLDLLMHHWNAVGEAFRTEDFFVPLLLEDEEGKSYGNNWAFGFLRGVDMHREAWDVILGDEDRAGRFIPILALANELNPDPSLRPYQEPMTDEQREKLLVGLSEVVTLMFHDLAPLRRSFASEPEPRKQKSKIGRNDPCYCGSGKKYKKCCGSIAVN